MTQTYKEWRYLWPPRPEAVIAPSFLSYYEKKNWVAQVKKNGTCTVIGVSPEKTITAMTRHQTEHKQWQPTEKSSTGLISLPGDGWHVFVAELMHSKGDNVKDTLYIHDILVHNGIELSNIEVEENKHGMSFINRQKILSEMFTPVDETVSHYVINNNLWLAKLITKDFKSTYDSLTKDQDEGLVIKNPNARLTACYKANSNSDWQVKCRKSTKNYAF